eukprot:7836116-Alexandrium_andersonii.AAC.1
MEGPLRRGKRNVAKLHAVQATAWSTTYIGFGRPLTCGCNGASFSNYCHAPDGAQSASLARRQGRSVEQGRGGPGVDGLL